MAVTLPERRSYRGASRYLLRCLLFLTALAALGALFQQPLIAAFLTNPYLNGAIGVTFLFGVAYTFRALIDTLLDGRAADRAAAVALKARRREVPLDQADALLLTIAGVRDVIAGLATEQAADTMALIAHFKDRLAAPLGGMGTSFSASLFGLLGALALGFLELQLFQAQNNHHAQLEALVVSDLVPLWQPVVTVTAQTETISPRHLAALLQATTDRLERVAATTEYLAHRGEGITRVAEQVANLGERIESLRSTLQNIENDRTADLRHELRAIARLLAQGQPEPRWDDDHAPSA